MTSYLDDIPVPKRFKPPTGKYRPKENNAEDLNNLGHEIIPDDFSDFDLSTSKRK